MNASASIATRVTAVARRTGVQRGTWFDMRFRPLLDGRSSETGTVTHGSSLYGSLQAGRGTRIEELATAILPRVPDDWDAATYDRIADPQARWGATVVGWLDLTGSERVLDAGCGSGRVTERLLERLPGGVVVALDGSPSMIEGARRRLAPFGDRVTYVVADLMEPLPVEPPVDAILSTATFHWVSDHDALFRNLSDALRPGGQLAAQCGGEGNLAKVERALRDIGASGFEDKTYATAEATRDRLEASGFLDIECWLHEEPTPFDSAEALEIFLATVVLRHHVEAMTPTGSRAFLREVVARLPSLELDYVRLNMRARRAS